MDAARDGDAVVLVVHPGVQRQAGEDRVLGVLDVEAVGRPVLDVEVLDMRVVPCA